MTATVLHLVRHGHVLNPRRVVYGRLPGWRLSAEGRRQAEAVAARLRERPIALVHSSPLERALETAAVIAAARDVEVATDPALVESELGALWEGLLWSDVKTARRQEWETYLHRPHEVAFVGETFEALAERMTAALRRVAARHEGGEAAVVSHGDPIKTAVCRLTGLSIARMHDVRVPTGSVVTLELSGDRAAVLDQWAPPLR